ncbi:MAG TPA: hypothetical protein VJM47_05420 [Nitrosospira sp.]|nr:hypothetical protein [Nitrosospira sp.]
MAYGIHKAETAEIESPSIQLTHPSSHREMLPVFQSTCHEFATCPLPRSDEITDDIQGKQDKADA